MKTNAYSVNLHHPLRLLSGLVLLTLSSIALCKDRPEHYQRPLYTLWPKTGNVGLPPAVIGVGAMKAGTTSLGIMFDDNLKAGFFKGATKEHRKFDCRWYRSMCPDSERNHSTLYYQNLSTVFEKYTAYADQWGIQVDCEPRSKKCTSKFIRNPPKFPGEKKFTWDISPGYMPQFPAPYHMREILPRPDLVKLIFIVREPIIRAISGWLEAAVVSPGIEYSDSTMSEFLLSELRFLKKCYKKAIQMTDGICQSPEERAAKARKCMDSFKKDQWGGIDVTPGMLYFQDRSLPPPLGTHLHREGNLYRGLYVDMLKNYLCAGFKQEQIMILATSEFEDPALIKRIANFVGAKESDVVFGEKAVHSHGKSRAHSITPEAQSELESWLTYRNRELVEFVRGSKFNVNISALEYEFWRY